MDTSSIKEIQCDECRKSFLMNLNEREHGKGIIETYIKCSHCNFEVTAFVTDHQARLMQKEVRDLHNKYIKTKGKLQVRMDSLKEQTTNG